MAAEGASAPQEATPDGLVEVRLPTARTTSSTWLPISRREKVAGDWGPEYVVVLQNHAFLLPHASRYMLEAVHSATDLPC